MSSQKRSVALSVLQKERTGDNEHSKRQHKAAAGCESSRRLMTLLLRHALLRGKVKFRGRNADQGSRSDKQGCWTARDLNRPKPAHANFFQRGAKPRSQLDFAARSTSTLSSIDCCHFPLQGQACYLKLNMIAWPERLDQLRTVRT